MDFRVFLAFGVADRRSRLRWLDKGGRTCPIGEIRPFPTNEIPMAGYEQNSSPLHTSWREAFNCIGRDKLCTLFCS
jgi:hypothetical protein